MISSITILNTIALLLALSTLNDASAQSNPPDDNGNDAANDELCSLDISFNCVPLDAPEGTTCDEYIPAGWLTDFPDTDDPDEFLIPAEVTYTILNMNSEYYKLGYLMSLVTIPGTDLGGPRELTPEVEGYILQPGESITISTEEIMDLSQRRQYGALVTVVGVNDENEVHSLCRGHDTFMFVNGFNTCTMSCSSDAECTCNNHTCSPFTNTCRDMGPALRARSKIICRNNKGGLRRCG